MSRARACQSGCPHEEGAHEDHHCRACCGNVPHILHGDCYHEFVTKERLRAEVDALEERIREAKIALAAIDAWEPPRVPCSDASLHGCSSGPHDHYYVAMFGLAGVRDYFRQIARGALAAIGGEAK